MAELEDNTVFQQDDHRAAYIFSAPSSEDQHHHDASSSAARPTKRRRVSSKKDGSKSRQQTAAAAEETAATRSAFTPLFNSESPEAVRLRAESFETAWPVLDARIQHVLREANRNTLDEVTSFIRNAEAETTQIPAGIIITGPNIASQDLLFEQLADTLCKATQARFVRLRSAEAPNLKAALKKIIKDARASGRDDDDDTDDDDETGLSVCKNGRKYLNYDLETLHVALDVNESPRVIVAFQDSEAFDSGLLTDLIALFHSWHDRIRFSVLFGIATSVQLFQARLLKSTARYLYGAQFDVVQAGSVLESVFKSAVAGSQALVRLGPSLLRNLVERQQDQVAGIQVFISSLKYAYMCHFYANPLSMFLTADGHVDRQLLQSEHIQAVRTLGSFKAHVEAAVEARQLNHAQSLLNDDSYLVDQILKQGQRRQDHVMRLLRSLHLITAMGILSTPFTDLYISALAEGISLSSDMFAVVDPIKRLGPDGIISLIRRLVSAIEAGSPELDLPGWESKADELIASLGEIRNEVESLVERTKDNRNPLKSKYGAHSKVLRTTVVAQKVQLSRDTATLTDEDNAFTKAINSLMDILSQHIHCDPAESLFLHEAWLYDSKSPYRDVFIPRLATTFGRALTRPHDYLGCACCGNAGGAVASTLPTTAILYHLYLEAGALINVADLWSAYYASVGDESELGLDERTALVHFYEGLAELRMMGFVRQSKKKADHVAKLKWL
ncbi:origin recognition complex subunit 3 N-terminus-domain-containing protein [Lasiosphaeria miniovina]|uniref:Origin recognition complex subunit 3 N-terminus-domain-containing protein n=1 Tax=Lasiosphaeria miniovina TaxID=1954250 RepID=A0AA40BGM3_9PEZI|nr:origin recognition complex subunit 3 N-terminus-domain-containing protein [Lasiosphaeria miniovina]KAK0733876.1 origin recognition complex subunit 3 N-terminus-domain-containing protein [Lasiosphaeria miniovina]